MALAPRWIVSVLPSILARPNLKDFKDGEISIEQSFQPI
jgi:hypothetical protein